MPHRKTSHSSAAQQAAALPAVGVDARGEIALVEVAAVAFRQAAERLAHVRPGEAVARAEGAPLGVEALGPAAKDRVLRMGEEVRAGVQNRRVVRGERVAAAELDGRGEELRQGLCGVALVQRGPARGRAGHGHGQPAALGHLLCARAGRQHALAREQRRGEAAGVEPGQRLAAEGDDGEAVPAHAVVCGIDDRQRRGHGQGGVHGVSALVQDLQAGLRGQRVGGGDHAPVRVDQVSPGGEGIVLRIKHSDSSSSLFSVFSVGAFRTGRPPIPRRARQFSFAVRRISG